MFTGHAIVDLVALLEQRQVPLHHACQYLDFLTYLDLGGIPSRALMEAHGTAFTPFDTDGSDHHNGVWDKVFINLSDFGLIFASRRGGVPNVYGPILCLLHPYALAEADDVAVALRSAGARGFDRAAESLTCLDEVEALFHYPQHLSFPNCALVMHGEHLRELFPNRPLSQNPEVSCTALNGRLPFEQCTLIVVDPYVVAGQPLWKLVDDAQRARGWNLRVVERRPNTMRMYQELAEHVRAGVRSLEALAARPWLSPDLQAWVRQVEANDLGWQFERYVRYLVAGTLSPLEGRAMMPRLRRPVPAH